MLTIRKLELALVVFDSINDLLQLSDISINSSPNHNLNYRLSAPLDWDLFLQNLKLTDDLTFDFSIKTRTLDDTNSLALNLSGDIEFHEKIPESKIKFFDVRLNLIFFRQIADPIYVHVLYLR